MYVQICGNASHYCRNLMKLEFSRMIFQKNEKNAQKIKFSKTPSNSRHWVRPYLNSKVSPVSPNLISKLSEFLRTQNLTPVFTILSLPTFWDKCIRVTSYFIFSLIYSSIILQSQNVLRDQPHAGRLARISNGRLQSYICITSVAHIGLIYFELQ